MSEKVLGISEKRVNYFIKEFKKELKKTDNQIYVPKKLVLEAFIDVFKKINEVPVISVEEVDKILEDLFNDDTYQDDLVLVEFKKRLLSAVEKEAKRK